jgi:hypothetical protein
MVKFNKETHTYTDKKKILISVTQLMKKHGLATDFSMVDEQVLNSKADRGTMIHEEIEAYINSGEIGFTSELSDYMGLMTKNTLIPSAAEVIVANDIVAGTLDQWGYDAVNNQFYIGDIKTGTTLNSNALRWQLSLYDYLLSAKVCKAPRLLYCFHLWQVPRRITVEPIPREEIERLLDCERKGEIYKQEVVVTDDTLAMLVQLKYEMDELDTQKKEIENRSNLIIETVKGLMRDKGIKCFENDLIKLTYVAPTTRETIDTKKLKADLPEIAAKYIKTSEIKDSVRITWRKEGE